MTTKEMKEILALKLADEGTYFKKSHISIKKEKSGYKIIIKDYEHIPFHLVIENDDYFGNSINIFTNWNGYSEVAYASNGKHELTNTQYISVLNQLGYYIGNTF